MKKVISFVFPVLLVGVAVVPNAAAASMGALATGRDVVVDVGTAGG